MNSDIMDGWMMDEYMIVEFNDGLQVIPSIWFNEERHSFIWPSHFKTQFCINKAIITREMPREISEWEELPINGLLAPQVKKLYYESYIYTCSMNSNGSCTQDVVNIFVFYVQEL